MTLEEIKKLSDEDLNVFLTRKLLKRKPVKPREYIANLKGKNASYYATKLQGHFGDLDRYVVVENDKPLKTHYLFADELPNFCTNISYCLQTLNKYVKDAGSVRASWKLEHRRGGFYCRVRRSAEVAFQSYAATPERAICETIALALED